MKVKIYKSNRDKRKIRVRAKIKGKSDVPRLSVFRSNRFIYCQLIDDEKGKTLFSCSDFNMTGSKGKKKTERAFEVGRKIAESAGKRGIFRAVFDRGSYKYHGRVKSLAEGAREGGLKF